VLAAFTKKPVPAPSRLTRLFGVGPGFIHVTHNPVGGVALDWLHELCFRDQTREDFFATTVPKAVDKYFARQDAHLPLSAGCQPAFLGTRVTLDPPFLGGDRLEIEAHRAAFRDLELTTDRLDLLAAVLEAMVRRHRQAVEALGQGPSFRRIFISGGGADLVRRLLPEYQTAAVHEIEEASLRGVAKLFEG
jgi:sugar (pentulose or hexulose) kinase